ncbi:MAG: translation initiation factor IF-2 [Anaerolineales bacterium]|nr:translation initiation factor IF-2 [Anaerolineales bacterium]
MSEQEEKRIELPTLISIRDMAERIQISPIEVMKKLMANGVMANINQEIDFDTAAIVVAEFGFEASLEEPPEMAGTEDQVEMPRWRKLIGDEDPAMLKDRPPVVTILGHVDHGKTTLLDAIRETNVASGEAGGITQHIGAYQVIHQDRIITFLDTPGHAAFTAMRARGAQGADIAILVVAADDGVMPQTREALAHVRAARVPILVALNKVDRPNANPEKVKKELADVGLVPDDWEGDTIVVPVSAKMRTGIEDVLEAVLLVADSTEIKANHDGKVLGTVIEAEVDKARGVVTTLLVQNGTLRVGDVVLMRNTCGKVRAMFDFQGKKVKEATPSMPVSVLGLSEVPDAGELFTIAPDERTARAQVAENQLASSSENKKQALSLDQIFEAYQAGQAQELKLIIKADVQGSLEPIVSSLNEMSVGGIKVNVLQAATGNIGENDVMLAAASHAIVLGFNVEADTATRNVADTEGVDIRIYDIIYRLTEDIEKALKGMLAPEIKREVLGHAQVLAIFTIPKSGKIAGCRVLDGVIPRNASVRVLRAGEEHFDGSISSLKHEHEDAREIRQGFECGIGLKGFQNYKEGDILEAYKMIEVAVV